MKSERWAPPKNLQVDKSERWAPHLNLQVDKSERWAPRLMQIPKNAKFVQLKGQKTWYTPSIIYIFYQPKGVPTSRVNFSDSGGIVSDWDQTGFNQVFQMIPSRFIRICFFNQDFVMLHIFLNRTNSKQEKNKDSVPSEFFSHLVFLLAILRVCRWLWLFMIYRADKRRP